MSSAWIQFRDKVAKAASKMGEHSVKGAVSDKLQSRGYDPQEAQRISNSLVNKARTGQSYDPNDPEMFEVTGYKSNIGASGWMMPALIAGAGVLAFSLLRRR